LYIKSFEELKGCIREMEIAEDEQLMVLVAGNSSDCIEELRDYLNLSGIKFFGGIYPKLLVGSKNLSEGFIVNKFTPVYSSLVLPYLMRFKQQLEADRDYTAIVLVDGLSSSMKELTDTIYDKLGSKVKYIGGGAGFYDLKHRPCIFDNKGVYEDAAYVCIVKSKISLEVKHGWNKLEGPYTITESRGNTLCKLDYYDAFEVYKDVIQDEEGITLYKEDFFTYAKEHPFGIVKKGEFELIVRDPIALNENFKIVCVADIPEDSEVYILKGNVDSLLSSSVQIAEHCSRYNSQQYKPFLIDCISRAMFMEERFEEELHNIQSKLAYDVEGALSIGEISSKSNGEVVIHNKSTVIGLFGV
jgi:hypothetical protein